MIAQYHPGRDTLLSYAVGALPPGAALAVGVHLEMCGACAAEARLLETIGGGVTAEREPAPLDAGAMDRALEALARERSAAAPPASSMPMAEAVVRGARWRWGGPGLQLATVRGAGAPGEMVYLLRGRPGAALAPHTHRGLELVAVLEGAFEDEVGVYRAGDLVERDAASPAHAPRVTREGKCLCLIATSGRLKLSGVARLLQPFLGV
ncbi:MAG: ChrR family anti-sigma-E factor [Caulobacteraceae bacterium]